MKIWLGLLGAPSLALACQAVLFALVTPSCSVQTRVVMHVVAAGSLGLSLLFTAWSRARWAALAGPEDEGADSDTGSGRNTRAFLARAATAVAALSSLTILAMWLAIWLLSPCSQ